MRLQHRRALVNSLIPLMGMSGYLAALLVGGSRIAGGAMAFEFAYSSTAIQGQDACEPDDVHQ